MPTKLIFLDLIIKCGGEHLHERTRLKAKCQEGKKNSPVNKIVYVIKRNATDTHFLHPLRHFMTPYTATTLFVKCILNKIKERSNMLKCHLGD